VFTLTFPFLLSLKLFLKHPQQRRQVADRCLYATGKLLNQIHCLARAAPAAAGAGAPSSGGDDAGADLLRGRPRALGSAGLPSASVAAGLGLAVFWRRDLVGALAYFVCRRQRLVRTGDVEVEQKRRLYRLKKG